MAEPISTYRYLDLFQNVDYSLQRHNTFQNSRVYGNLLLLEYKVTYPML